MEDRKQRENSYDFLLPQGRERRRIRPGILRRLDLTKDKIKAISQLNRGSQDKFIFLLLDFILSNNTCDQFALKRDLFILYHMWTKIHTKKLHIYYSLKKQE